MKVCSIPRHILHDSVFYTSTYSTWQCVLYVSTFSISVYAMHQRIYMSVCSVFERVLFVSLFYITVMIMMIMIVLKGANRDFLQSPHRAANCLLQVRSSGKGTIVRYFFTCQCVLRGSIFYISMCSTWQYVLHINVFYMAVCSTYQCALHGSVFYISVFYMAVCSTYQSVLHGSMFYISVCSTWQCALHISVF